MHPSSVPILHLSGSPREQGHQHGEALRASIAEVREQWRASITTRFKVHPDAFIDALVGETRFVDAMRRWAPSLLDEVEGIAEGSGRPLAETLAFQFMDEEWWFGTVRFLKPAATAQAIIAASSPPAEAVSIRRCWRRTWTCALITMAARQ
jgi:isopenicillin-N N-acyltransferase-like protein